MTSVLAHPRPIVATWLVLDSPGGASYYPATGFRSSDHPQVHLIYWRCVACYFATAFRVLGDAYRLVLYTTADEMPSNVRAILDRCGVEVERVPLAHLPPAGYTRAWRNQFYILDVIRHICRNTPADVLILDSDCLCVSNLAPLFTRLREEGVLTYHLDYDPHTKINGLSRLEMQDLFGELLGKPIAQTPVYYGGEIFAATARELKKIDGEIDRLWTQCLVRAKHELPKLNEEAHFLSCLYLKLGYRDATANDFIRRIWTQVALRNGRQQDLDLPIWHVPAEKRYGIRDLYSLVVDPGSWFWSMPPNALWRSRLAVLLGIPEARLFKRAKDLARGVKHKVGVATSTWVHRENKASGSI